MKRLTLIIITLLSLVLDFVIGAQTTIQPFIEIGFLDKLLGENQFGFSIEWVVYMLSIYRTIRIISPGTNQIERTFYHEARRHYIESIYCLLEQLIPLMVIYELLELVCHGIFHD